MTSSQVTDDASQGVVTIEVADVFDMLRGRRINQFVPFAVYVERTVC